VLWRKLVEGKASWLTQGREDFVMSVLGTKRTREVSISTQMPCHGAVCAAGFPDGGAGHWAAQKDGGLRRCR